jgi:hypothetical protein
VISPLHLTQKLPDPTAFFAVDNFVFIISLTVGAGKQNKGVARGRSLVSCCSFSPTGPPVSHGILRTVRTHWFSPHSTGCGLRSRQGKYGVLATAPFPFFQLFSVKFVEYVVLFGT